MKRSITVKHLDLVVEYDYTPGEACIRYDDNLEGYPGYPARVVVNSVFHAGENIDNFIEDMDWWTLLEEIVLTDIENEKE